MKPRTFYAVYYASKYKNAKTNEYDLLNNFIIGDSIFSNKEDARAYMKETFQGFRTVGFTSKTINETEDVIEIEESDGLMKKRAEVMKLYADSFKYTDKGREVNLDLF